ncbi:MAG: hypothetical protein J5850_04285 [Clostridia bacterium]|nr:hypothetical protein [Clostridia bacterium]
MNEERNQNRNQIIRIDAKNCFVESLNDSFEIGRIHFNFASYDLTKPAGSRQTNCINIYIPVEEFLETSGYIRLYYCRGELEYRKNENNTKAVRQWLGGTSAEKLLRLGKPRADGKSLSRIAQISWGNKSAVLFSAASGPGETDEKGLIRPAFGNRPENYVMIPMTYESLVQLFAVTEAHYTAWLAAKYMKEGADNA